MVWPIMRKNAMAEAWASQRKPWTWRNLEKDYWRNIPWVLKNSIFLEIAEIWGIENVYQNGESHL